MGETHTQRDTTRAVAAHVAEGDAEVVQRLRVAGPQAHGAPEVLLGAQGLRPLLQHRAEVVVHVRAARAVLSQSIAESHTPQSA